MAISVSNVSVKNLFGNYYAGANKNVTGLSSLYTSLSDYSSIRSGSYGKLLNAYYDSTGTSAVKSLYGDTSSSIKKAEGTADKKITAVKASSDELKTSAMNLVETDLFEDVESVTDDIVSAVGNFVNDYNSLIDDADSADNTSISDKVSYMTNQISSYSKSLEKVGITINSDNTLSVDKDKLKTADVDSVEALFNGRNSLAYNVAIKSTAVGSAAQLERYSSLYGAGGTYSSSYYNSSYDWYL